MGYSTVLSGRVKEKPRIGKWGQFNGYRVFAGRRRSNDMLEDALHSFEDKMVLITITEIYSETKSSMESIVEESKSATGWWFNHVWRARWFRKHPPKRKMDPESTTLNPPVFSPGQLKSQLLTALDYLEGGRPNDAALVVENLTYNIREAKLTAIIEEARQRDES
jgi:hypothetical protein